MVKETLARGKYRTGTGLYYYGARYYDPRMSIWLSTDPLQEKYPNISTYAYTFQNPVRYIDPTGMEGEDDDKPIKKTTTDAGHGDKPKGATQIDPGTVSTDKNHYEKDYALMVEKEVAYWLERLGFDNDRSRTDDIEKPNEKRVNWRYTQANKRKSEILVSFHLDSGNSDGSHYLYYTDEGKKLGESIMNEMSILPLDSKRNNYRDDIGVIKHFKGKAAVLIELVGIDSETGRNSIKNNASTIGYEIAVGIYKYAHGDRPATIREGKPEYIINWFTPQDFNFLNK